MHLSFKPLLLIPLLSLLLFSCKDNGTAYISPTKETVIIYIAADNNLINAATNNINEMESAFTDESKNLIVYMDLGYEGASYN